MMTQNERTFEQYTYSLKTKCLLQTIIVYVEQKEINRYKKKSNSVKIALYKIIGI